MTVLGLSWARRLLLPLLSTALATCGHGGTQDQAGGYFGGSVALECAPFARALSGVSLSGAGADWWRQAEGRYDRSRTPDIGSVLVFRRSDGLPYGHVSVVSQVLSRREILVTSANWVHHRVTADQPVVDVSGDGDWSEVRVWWPPSGQMGSTSYAVFGFIRPDRPLGHDRLITDMPGAIRVAERNR